MISEQVKELRNLADYFQRQNRDYYTAPALSEAADTIESLYAKLQAVNEEREKEDHNGDILSETLEWINKRIGTKLKLEAMTNDEVYEFGHRKSIETFQEVRLYIETEIAEQKEKRSAEDCGGWIPCKNKPERKRDESSRPVLVRYKDETANPDVCKYNFLTGKFVFIEKDVTEFVKEWREIPGYEP